MFASCRSTVVWCDFHAIRHSFMILSSLTTVRASAFTFIFGLTCLKCEFIIEFLITEHLTQHRRPKVSFGNQGLQFTNRRAVYRSPYIGNVLFDGSLIRASANYGCFMTLDAIESSSFAKIPDNLRVWAAYCSYCNCSNVTLLIWKFIDVVYICSNMAVFWILILLFYYESLL